MRHPDDAPLPPCACGGALRPAYWGREDWRLVCASCHATASSGATQREARLKLRIDRLPPTPAAPKTEGTAS